MSGLLRVLAHPLGRVAAIVAVLLGIGLFSWMTIGADHAVVITSLLGLALVGAPLFVIVGVVTGLCFYTYTTDIKSFGDFGWVIEPLEELMGRDAFLAIPLFIASGAIMTAGGLARRLVDIARAGLGWLPGGLAVSAVGSCMFFAAISGSSPVTLIAVGSIMVPAMIENDYPENFSLGIVMTAGSLGCLVPPALSILIYAIAIPGDGGVDPGDMFLAAVLPAVLIATVLSVYAIWVGRSIPGERPKFSAREFLVALRDGIWALLIPVIVLGGIYGGFFPPFKAGAVAVVYALIVTVFIYRELDLGKAIGALADAGKLMGMLIMIIGLAFGLNKFLSDVKIEDAFVGLLQSWDLGPVGFMLLVNLVLIVLGALMDSISATLIFAPILAPIAYHHYGMDPIHFGVVFVVNMEIGYLAPPVATNLFVASALFKKPFGQVCRAILPGLAITCAALALFMYVPTCSMGLVNYQRGEEIWQPFPWDGKPAAQTRRASESAAESLSSLSKKTATTDDEAQELNTQTDDEYYGREPDGGVEDDELDVDLSKFGGGGDGDAGPPGDGGDAGPPGDGGDADLGEAEEEEDYSDVPL